MNRILIEFKSNSVVVKNVNPKEETVDKISFDYSVFQGPAFKRLDTEYTNLMVEDLLKTYTGDAFSDSTIYLIFPQSVFHVLSLPSKPELSRIQQYNEHKFEVNLIFPYMQADSFSIEVQPLEPLGFYSSNYSLVTVIDNSLLNLALKIKKAFSSKMIPKVKILSPFLSLKQFIKNNFPNEQSSVLLHISGSSIIFAYIRGNLMYSVYSTNFIDIPSIPDIIDSFLLNNSAGRIDKDTLSSIYISLEEYMVGLTPLVEKWMGIKTFDTYAGLPLGKVSKIPPDLLSEIRSAT
jgi:hypothetical protein